MERRKNDARRSTRLAMQVPVVVTGLDPACDFHKECKTVFVNAHGCGFITRERLKDGTPVMMKLVANGASKKGSVVLAIRLLENVSWLLGAEFDSPRNFWEVESPPQTGASEERKQVL